MKVNLTNTFFESLEKIQRYEAWHNRAWRALTRDFWIFLKNVWKFRKELWDHRWWDYSFTLQMIRRSLIIMERGMHDGMEVRETLDKKIEKMQRAIQILDNIIDSRYIEMAEAELGPLYHVELEFETVENRSDLFQIVDRCSPEEKSHNSRVYSRSNELEKVEWGELWEIFQGQDYDKFNKEIDWTKQFDGSGLRNWWD
jgi:hypothetical protein